MEMKNLTHEEMDEEFQRRVDMLRYLVEKDIMDYRDISKVVVGYYQYPEETVSRVRREMGWASAKTLEANGGDLLGG